ncbi:hypothetical protein [Pseudoalteromonas sp. P1-9]|uniref:hypothetical protein n=1 Tax=Pseudoalteromonas sp. P1-9 TaxID=1710354 RepID=UPI0013791421|nr:hypothetical protein [Pseudoalteromonas sp. P1-9]
MFWILDKRSYIHLMRTIQIINTCILLKKNEWRYIKDSSVAESDDADWIDNIKFAGQTN